MDASELAIGVTTNGPYDEKGNLSASHFEGTVLDFVQGSQGRLVLVKDNASVGTTLIPLGELLDFYTATPRPVAEQPVPVTAQPVGAGLAAPAEPAATAGGPAVGEGV